MTSAALGDFEEKVAVVTGGGRGFGNAFGHALAERGARVALLDLDQAAASAAAREIGTMAEGLAGDVADEPAMLALM